MADGHPFLAHAFWWNIRITILLLLQDMYFMNFWSIISEFSLIHILPMRARGNGHFASNRHFVLIVIPEIAFMTQIVMIFASWKYIPESQYFYSIHFSSHIPDLLVRILTVTHALSLLATQHVNRTRAMAVERGFFSWCIYGVRNMNMITFLISSSGCI